jgi:ABC-2 type transport system permease protein
MSSVSATTPTTARPAGPSMSLWRLEVLRLVRTHRWALLAGVYAFFGVVGPLTARYLHLLLGNLGGDLTVIAPDPRPVDGILQFVGNTSQLGILVVVVVAAGALAFDAHPERAAFLRTRMLDAGRLVVAPFAVTAVATVTSLVIGTLIAVGLTAVLLGTLPPVALLIGTAYGALYLVLVVAVVAVVSTLVRTQITTVLLSLLALLALPMFATIGVLRSWLPSELVTAVVAMLEGAPAGEFLRASAVSVLATAALLVTAIRRSSAREL